MTSTDSGLSLPLLQKGGKATAAKTKAPPAKKAKKA